MPVTSSEAQIVRLLRDPKLTANAVRLRLLEGGDLFKVCAEAVSENNDWIDGLSPEDRDLCPARPGGSRSPSVGYVLNLIRTGRPRDLPRACALVYAAQCVKARLKDEGRGATRRHVAAVLAWEMSLTSWDPETQLISQLTPPPEEAGEETLTEWMRDHPSLCWEPVADLLEVLALGRRRPGTGSIEVPMVHGDPAMPVLGRLVVNPVPDPRERALPDPMAMIFGHGLDPITSALSDAFQWSRAREGFPRGRGVHWTILGASGEPTWDPGSVDAEAAAALAFGQLFPAPRGRLSDPREWRRRSLDPQAVVLARMAANGRLLPIGRVTEATRTVLAAGCSLVVAQEDLPSARAAVTDGRRSISGASTIGEAARLSRAQGSGREWNLASAVVLALVLALVAVGTALDQRSQAESVRQNARRLAGNSLELAVDGPDRALVESLAAETLTPNGVDARAAMLTTAHGDSRLRRIVPTHLQNLGQLALNATASVVAGIGPDAVPHAWSVDRGTEFAWPGARLAAHAIAFPQKDGPLAAATDHGVTLWNPALPGDRPLELSTTVPVASIVLSADGRSLAGGLVNGTVVLWRLTGTSWSAPRVVQTHGEPVAGLAFSLPGTTLAATGSDGTTLTRLSASGNPEKGGKKIAGKGRAVAMSDATLFVLGDSTLEAWSLHPLRRLHAPFAIHPDVGMAYSARTNRIYFPGVNGILQYFADPESLSAAKGALSSAGNGLDAQASVGSVMALGGDGQYGAAKTASGAVLIYQLDRAESPKKFSVGMIRAIYPIPGSASAVEVAGPPIRSTTLLKIDRTSGDEQGFVNLPTSQSPGRAWNFSQATGFVAVAGGTAVSIWRVREDGFEKLDEFAEPGQSAVAAFFDDTRHTMTAVWSRTIVVYDTKTSGHLTELSRSTMTGVSVRAAVPDTDRRTMFAASTTGLYALPLVNGVPSWGTRVKLTSVFEHLLAAGPDGSVVAGTLSGQVSIFRHEQDASWHEVALQGGGGIHNLLVVADDLVVSVGHSSVVVSDAATGRYLATLNLEDMVLPVGAQYDAPVLKLFGDIPGVVGELALGREALKRKACGLLPGSEKLTVADAWPQAPTSERNRHLCAFTSSDRWQHPATSATAASPTSVKLGLSDVHTFLEAFLKDLRMRDSTGMLRRATPDVVKQYAGQKPNGGAYRLAWSNNCRVDALGSGSCEFLLTESATAHALIYIVHYTTTPDGLRIDKIFPGGDAG